MNNNEDGSNTRFPKKLLNKRNGKTLVTIYKFAGCYTVSWRPTIDGKKKQRVKDFAQYSPALKFAEEKARELVDGLPTLSPDEISDAFEALKCLKRHYQFSGRHFGLLDVAKQFVQADALLKGRLLSDAVAGFLHNAADVNRLGLREAVEKFIAVDEPKTKSANGERPQIGQGYLSQRKGHLLKLANLFAGYSVCDLTKAHIDKFFAELPTLPQRMKNALPPVTPKSRNHHRGSIKMFFEWAVRNDFLASNHRLLEAESMRTEKNGHGETEFYTPQEFGKLLEGTQLVDADARLLPLIAIGGLAGLRSAELIRLSWEDVWRVEGHIEVTAGKAKTRQRRLVEMCDALKLWLAPYRQFKTGKLWPLDESKFQDRFLELCQLLKMARKPNGLRHSFGSFHFALHANENLTAQQMGNSPAMIHGHYKGLATKAEAEAWFAVKPEVEDNVIPMKSEVAK